MPMLNQLFDSSMQVPYEQSLDTSIANEAWVIVRTSSATTCRI